MLEVENRYYKHAANERPLMSGLPLPNYRSGVVIGVRFVDCSFHPDCEDVKFVNCEFVNCTGVRNIPANVE